MPGLAAPAPRQQANTMSAEHLAEENIWFDKYRYDDAERRYYEQMNGPVSSTPAGRTQTAQENGANTILQDIARARENIQKSLAGSVGCTAGEQSELVSRINSLELENRSLYSVVEDLRLAISKLETRVSQLEKSPAGGRPTLAAAAPCTKVEVKKEEVEDDDDDDIDLFGSDDEEEDADAARIREERLQQYAAKKAKKPVLIAKSSILLDVKPWDDETDMVKMEECVRSVQAEGLLWGSSKLVPVGYGIKKLQIQCVVEDDKVGTDMLEEEITKFEDLVQSVDVAAFNKI
ncbi:elongation factor 1-delta isoform X3 [Acipenser ruthenus]|uniref:elongation factor 1-delta isoform X3 n=1 Tax=Acipenser ruthenus TaxID=7906 RepID=UPI002741150A|nr:elongation factor 1-delta isoform X3 [Acipenser ruthenus]